MEAVEKITGSHGYCTQLSFSADKLRNKDIFSKSDPMLVAYIKKRDGSLEEVGRTEVILNSLNPRWITDLTMMFNFEESQTLVFKIFDVDTKFSGIPVQKLKLENQTHLGETDCNLSEIITAPGQSLVKALRRENEQVEIGPECGTLTIRAEELARLKFLVNMVISADQLDNKDTFSKSDPYLVFSRVREDGSTTPAFRTEVKKNTLSPEWKPIKVTLAQLCNGDKDRPLKIECLNFNNSGRADLIGGVQLSLNEIMRCTETGEPIQLQRKSHGVSHAIKNSGVLKVKSCSIEPYHSFLDYIFGGCEINFMVAVDFTASNGSPFQPDSLHYADPTGRPNKYQQAILAVGEVLQHYDSDQRFPAWGFGGRPIDGPVSHCFALNGNHQAAEVNGISGILHAYSQALRHVALAGPTLFAPVINMAASFASQHVTQENQKYFVLLIITDGVITDLTPTITALVQASHLPLSVLIVGVGGADFTEMEALDADKKRLQTLDGRPAQRDIVQFVPMDKVERSSELAKQLLAELPYQFLDFMNLKKIVPNQPRGQPPPPL
ncbi:hypothetical protein R1sor_020970 [Riccia sorocarpa]|uniref:Uncharacterized protein n=1 Tax=Riccia sorocarpa TaxID=122646 RepID=A0ABD3GHT8_9MARC